MTFRVHHVWATVAVTAIDAARGEFALFMEERGGRRMRANGRSGETRPCGDVPS